MRISHSTYAALAWPNPPGRVVPRTAISQQLRNGVTGGIIAEDMAEGWTARRISDDAVCVSEPTSTQSPAIPTVLVTELKGCPQYQYRIVGCCVLTWLPDGDQMKAGTEAHERTRCFVASEAKSGRPVMVGRFEVDHRSIHLLVTK
jgi:hypothetical protein